MLLRILLGVLVVKKSAARERVVDTKIELPSPELHETIHSCIKALETDPAVDFSANQIESNEEDFDWASQGWSKVSRVWPQGVVEVFHANQTRRAGGLGALNSEPLGGKGENGKFVMATEEQMEASVKTLRLLIMCCHRTKTLFTMRSGGHCNAGCSSMDGHMTFGIKGLNIVAPKDIATGWGTSLEPWESPGTVVVGAGSDAGQSAYFTFNESFRSDPNHRIKQEGLMRAHVPAGFAGGLPVGQKPTVGTAGLTLGGGFGFHTRYAGLLCDRLISLEAVHPETGDVIHATKHNEHRLCLNVSYPNPNPN